MKTVQRRSGRMIRGLESMVYKGELKKLGSLGLKKTEGITTPRYIKDYCKEKKILVVLHVPHAQRK